MRVKIEDTFEVKLYLGSKESYNGREFSFEELTKFIGQFQKDRDDACPLRITQCHFVFEDYLEQGWEVGVINYPRFPKEEGELWRFMCSLAEHLLEHFKQNRISVISPKHTHMFEVEEAKQTHEEE
jgi:hypothetical protein